MKKIVILKIGTTSITKDCDQGINLEILESLAKASCKIIKHGYKVVIVSSGAMGLGLARLGSDNVEKIVGENPCKTSVTSYKQALTAVGQIELMKEYQKLFAKENIEVGQVLVTHTGIKDDHKNTTLKETIEKLFELNVVPIINANDTVSPKEILVGDNDSLASRIAILLEAEKLFLLTDVEGVYNKDPNKHDDAKLIEEIKDFDEEIKNLAGESLSKVGTGGMRSKLNAAEVSKEKGVQVEILDAKNSINLDQLLLDKDHSIKSTTILPN